MVPNGLSLCKIHHAAYDANLLGVKPNLIVEVLPRLMKETDGPMLTHGLKGMEGAVPAIFESPHSRSLKFPTLFR